MKRMPDKPDTWAWLATWLEQNWPALYAGALPTPQLKAQALPW
jgi:hypothetical protein